MLNWQQLTVSLAIFLLLVMTGTQANAYSEKEFQILTQGLDQSLVWINNNQNMLKKTGNKIVAARKLAVKCANGIYTKEDRETENFAFVCYLDEVSRLFEIYLKDTAKRQGKVMTAKSYKDTNWKKLVLELDSSLPVVLDGKSPAVKIPMPLDGIRLFYDLFHPSDKIYDSHSHLPKNKDSNFIHISTPEAAYQSITKLDYLKEELDFAFGKLKAWQQRLSYVKDINQALILNDNHEVTVIQKQIEQDMFILTIKTSYCYISRLQRKIFNYRFQLFMQELGRIQKCYGLSSKYLALDITQANLLSVESAEKIRIEVASQLK